MRLFDAHCHVISPEAIERAAIADVAGIAICGTSPKDWDAVFSCLEYMAKKSHGLLEKQTATMKLVPMLGIHPMFVSKDWNESFQALDKLVRADAIGSQDSGRGTSMLSIGETGLDFRDQFMNRTEQEACFISHLDLARETNRPVAVHCVKAWGRLLAILRQYPVPRILLHAFGGSVDLIPELVDLNSWFSFGPAVMNPNAKRVRSAAAAVPEERLLIESDFSGTPQNEPSELIHIARAVAELRGVSVDEIAALTFDNARAVLG